VLSHYIEQRTRLDHARAALAHVPFLAHARLKHIKLEPLGSLTNATFKLTTDDGVYALRLPGKDTSDYVYREAEEHNSRLAATAGINTEVIYFNAEDGMMVSRFIEGDTMNEVRFGQDPGAPARAALVLARVHRLGRIFKSRFNLSSVIGGYVGILRKQGMPLPAGYYEVEREAKAVRRALEASPVPLVPCHNDPWPGNFVDAGDRLYLIDWEFSGMNDPMWDLGDLSVEAGFGPEQDRMMMEAYCGNPVPPALYSRLELYKTMSDLLWSLWGFIQHANDNPRDDFLTYALGRLERCNTRMGSADFGRHLGAVRESLRTPQDVERYGLSRHRFPESASIGSITTEPSPDSAATASTR
jgi:thiamine kinase-like enzyme